jgi:hypothetical protein
MPDTNKQGNLSRIPRQQELVYPEKADPSALAKLLDEWMQGDEADQRETFEFLRCSLEEHRPDG